MTIISRGGNPIVYRDALGRRKVLRKVVGGSAAEPLMSFSAAPGATDVTVEVGANPVRLVNPANGIFVEFTVSKTERVTTSQLGLGAVLFATLIKSVPATGQSWVVSASFGEADDGTDPTPADPITSLDEPTFSWDGRRNGDITYTDPRYTGGKTGHTMRRFVEFYNAETGGTLQSTVTGIPAKAALTWDTDHYAGFMFEAEQPDGTFFRWRTTRKRVLLAAGPSKIETADVNILSGVDAATNLATGGALNGTEYRPRWSFSRSDLVGSSNRPVAGEVGYRFTSSTQADPNPIILAKLAGGNDPNGEPIWTTEYQGIISGIPNTFDASYVTTGDARSKRLTLYRRVGASEWSVRGDELVTLPPDATAGSLEELDWATSFLDATTLADIMNTTHSTWDYSADWGGWNGTQGRLAAFDNAHTFPMTVLAAAIGLRSAGNSAYARFRNTYATKNAAGNNVNQTPLQRVVAMVKHWGGTSQSAPVMQGGFPPQGEIAYAATCLMIKNLLKDVWEGTIADDGTTSGANKITALERSRIDWGMRAYAAVSAYFASEDYPFKAFGFPATQYPRNTQLNPPYTSGDRNIRGHSANTTTNAVPNFYFPIRVIAYICGHWIGGATAYQNFLWDFDVDTFLGTCPTPIGANQEAYDTLNNMQWTAEKIRIAQGVANVTNIAGWYFPGPTKAQFNAALNRVTNTTTGAKAEMRLRVNLKSGGTTTIRLTEGTRFAADAINKLFNGTVYPGVLNRRNGENGPDAPYDTASTTNKFGVKRDDRQDFLAGCFWPKTRWKDVPHKGQVCLPTELASSDGGGNGNDNVRSSPPYVWKGTNGTLLGILSLMTSGALDKSNSQWTTAVDSLTPATRLARGLDLLKFMDGGYRAYSKGGGSGAPTNNDDALGFWAAPSTYMLPSRYVLVDLCRAWIEN